MSRLRSLQPRRKSVYTPANEMKDGLTGGEPHEVLSMFTVGAFMLLALIAWLAGRANEKDRSTYDRADDNSVLALHTRQDIKFIAFLLGGVIVMLGIIADKIK
jgi:hypothetical protein